MVEAIYFAVVRPAVRPCIVSLLTAYMSVCARVRDDRKIYCLHHESLFKRSYLWNVWTYFNETTYLTSATFSVSQVIRGQRSRWGSGDHRGLVNLIAREPLNGFEPNLAQILILGNELERFSRREVKDQDVDLDQIVNL